MLVEPSVHILKIYEALSCIGDSRLTLGIGSPGVISAQVISSGSDKVFSVSYRPSALTLCSGESSIWYAGLSLLLFLDVLDYQSDYGESLSSIDRDAVDFSTLDLSLDKVDEQLVRQWVDVDSLHIYCESLLSQLWSMDLHYEDVL